MYSYPIHFSDRDSHHAFPDIQKQCLVCLILTIYLAIIVRVLGGFEYQHGSHPKSC